MNKKAQANALSTILVIAIVVTLVLATYNWGNNLLNAQKLRTQTNYVEIKLLEIRSNVIEVSHEGSNSTRIVQFDVSMGKLKVESGTPCENGAINKNAVIFELDSKTKLIEADDWIIIDPTENSSNCNVSYSGNKPGVLLAKAERSGNIYLNTYMMWFHRLEDEGSVKYLINITAGSGSEASGNTHTVAITNMGTANESDGNTINTNVQINIY